MAEDLTDIFRVLLFNKTIIVFLVRARTGNQAWFLWRSRKRNS
jgi:hypothetical protein